MSHDLMRPILADHADDGPRLVYADWLDEHGEPERAEFIRVQIEVAKQRAGVYLASEANDRVQDELSRREVELWLQVRDSYEYGWMQLVIDNGRMRDQHRPIHGIVRRGFPHSIACTMARLMGGECERCEGRGYGNRQPGDEEMDCLHCNGTGRVPGLIDTVFSQWPVTEVRLTDCPPLQVNIGTFINPVWNNYGFAMPQYVAEIRVFRKLIAPRFASRNAALLALSHACVDLGRERAGLPAIRRHGRDVKRKHPGEALLGQPG